MTTEIITPEKTKDELEIEALEKDLENAGTVGGIEKMFDRENQSPEEEEPVVSPAAPKPEEGAKPPVTPVVGEEDELPPVEEGANPTPDDWKVTKGKFSSLKEKNKALQKKLDEKEVTPPPTPVVAQPPVTPESDNKLSADDIFHVAAQAQSNDYGDEAKSKTLLNEANLAMEDLSVSDVLAVVKKAKAGGFGTKSEDVLLLAREALPETSAREQIRGVEESRESNAQAEIKVKTDASYSKATKEFPELSDKKNVALMTFAQQWRDENIGKTDEAGKFVSQGPMVPLIQANPNWPELISKMIMDSFKASGGVMESAGVVGPAAPAAPTQPVTPAAPKKREGYVPEGASVPSGGGGTGDAEISALEKTLKKMGKIGD